jgi:ornithine carbamoyltransferase
MVKHFLEIEHYPADELTLLLDRSAELKQVYKNGGSDNCLTGKTMVMLFEKPSSRTRISFQVGMTQLGGSAVYVRPEDIGGLGQREPISDLTRVLNGYVDVIVARTFAHESVLELARYATVPVINALTNLAHPCQAMADMLTMREQFGSLAGKKLAYVGDGNNMARSLGMACMRLGVNFAIASPPKYALPQEFLERLARQAKSGQLWAGVDVREAVRNADIVYTDTWTSMGQEAEKEQRMKDFAGYQIDGKVMAGAGINAKVMHCLPAYRGLEITDEVLESEQSIVFQQAENRLHFQRALLKYLVVG